MSWDYQRSSGRVRDHLDKMGDIEVTKLNREADLEALLSETCCRQIYGAHVYVPVTNFARLVTQEPDSPEAYKGLIQALHIYQREVSRIVEDDGIFDAVRVHFQGSKLHALLYRPIRDACELATRAFLLQLVLKDFVRNVFNPAFSNVDDFNIAGGADLGEAIGTRNGLRGSRELLFLGAPANHAAKIVSTSGRLRLTSELYDELPDDLQGRCDEVDGGWQIQRVSQSDLDELTEKYSIGWDREKSAERVNDDKALYPLSVIQYSSASTRIQLDELSIRNNKRVLAASVFGDVTGFTAYIDSATTEAEQREALRNFHAIRREIARVVKNDFNGLHVQFQGDRVQGLFHLPNGDADAIAVEATDAGVGLQSSMEDVLKQTLSGIGDLQIAVGVDQSMTLVSKTGTRGHRDRLCVGDAVEDGARCEERCAGGEVGVTSEVHGRLPDRLKKHFQWDEKKQCYVAAGLTTEKVDRASKASALYNSAVFIRPDGQGVRISGQEGPDARKVVPAKPYAP